MLSGLRFHWGLILYSSKLNIINVQQPFSYSFLPYCSTLYLKEQVAYKQIDVIPILRGGKKKAGGIMLLSVVSRHFLCPWLCYSVMAGWMWCSQTATPEVTGCNLYREPVCLHGDRRWRQQIHMAMSLKQPPWWLRALVQLADVKPLERCLFTAW